MFDLNDYKLLYYKNIIDTNGGRWRLEVLKRTNEQPASVKEICGLQSLSLSVQGAQEEVDAPIVKTSLSIGLVDCPDIPDTPTEKHGSWQEFFTPDATLYLCRVLSWNHGGYWATAWSGYITPDSWSEPLGYRGTVTITARDNIGHLADFPFDYVGEMISVGTVIHEAFKRVDFAMQTVSTEGRQGDNAEQRAIDGTPLYDALIPVEAFEGCSWLEALTRILSSFGWVIRYTGDNTVSFGPLRNMTLIGASTHEEVRTTEIQFLGGGTRTIAPAYKQISDTIDYKQREAVAYDVTTGYVDSQGWVLTPTSYTYKLPDGFSFTAPGQALYSTIRATAADALGWVTFSGNPYGRGYDFMPAIYPGACLLATNFVNDAPWRRYNFRHCNLQPCTIKLGYLKHGITVGDGARVLKNTNYSLASFVYRLAYVTNGATYYYNVETDVWSAQATSNTFTAAEQYSSSAELGITNINFGGEPLTGGRLSLDIGQISYTHPKGTATTTTAHVGSAMVLQSIALEYQPGTMRGAAITTINNPAYNIESSRTTEIAPARDVVRFMYPSDITNTLYKQTNGTIEMLPWFAKWNGETAEMPLPILTHLQILQYHFTNFEVLEGDVAPVNGEFDFGQLYTYKGNTYLLQDGALDILSGRLLGATFRQFAKYEDIWPDETPEYTIKDAPIGAAAGSSSGGASGGSSGASSHEALTGRGEVNQHPISAITDLRGELSNKADKSNTYTKAEVNTALSGKASTDHPHNIEDVDGLEDALAQTDASIAGLEAALNDKTSINHTHVIEDVDGLEDALTALETDINTKAPLVSGKIPQAYLPSYVDDVLEYASKAAFPAGGESGKIYISTNDNKTYRWSGSTYVEISASLALGETSSTAYAGDKGRQLRTEVDDLQSTVEGISSTIEGVAYQRSVDALTAKVDALPDLETVITNINFNGNDLTPSEDDPHSVSFTAAAVDHTHTNVYAPNTHSHGINDVNGLQAELQTLDGHLSDVADELSGKAAVSALAGYLPLTGGTLTAANTPLILKSTGSSLVRVQLFRADGAGVEIGYDKGQAFFTNTHNANWGLSIYDDGTAAIRNGTGTASTTRIILTEQNVGSYALPRHGTAENSYALGGQLPSYYALREHNANWASVQTYENEGGVVRYYWHRAGRLTGANAVLVFDVVVVDDANYPTNYHGQIVASKYAVSGGGFSCSISGVGSPVVTTSGNNRVTRVDALIDTNGYVWLRANVAWDGSALRFRPVYSYGAQVYSTNISAQLDPPSYTVFIQGNGAQRYHTPTGTRTSSGLSLDGVTVTSAQSATSATYASNAANAAWLGTTTDGSDFKHILEKKGTSASTQFQEHKWYRIGESLRNKGFAQSCILLITQRYNSAECESAAFAISYGWGKAKCSITQLSGSNLMSAIRLVWSGNNSENVYLEVLYNGHATNEFQFTTIGSFTIYDAPFSEGALIDGGNGFSFNTANGFKTSGELWAGDTSFRALHDTINLHDGAITALQSSLGNYLPLTGGTLTGDFTYKRILFYGGDEINTSSGSLNLGYRDTPEGIRLCGANQPLTYGTAARPILHTGNIAQHALTAGNLSQYAATLAGVLDEYFNNYTHPEFNVPTTTAASVYRITLDSEGHVTSAQAVDIDAMVQNAASAWAGDAPTWENILDYLGGNNDNLPDDLEAAPLSYVRIPKATSSTIGAVKLDNASGLELNSNGAIKVKLGTGLSINSSGQLCASSGATPSGNAPVQVTPLDSLDGQSGINQSSLTQRGWDAGVIEGMMNGTIDRVKIVESSNAWRILPVCYVHKTATELNIRIGSGDDTSGFGLYYIDLWKNLSSGTFTVNIYDNN